MNYLITTGISFLKKLQWSFLPVLFIQSPAIADEFLMADIAKHASEADCWLVIDGNVYDVTTYLPYHLAPPNVILQWCGKDATTGFETKDDGKPHSATAQQLLKRYQVGKIVNK